jgi:hypothetical protein
MNLRDVRLAKKLGNNFFKFSDELLDLQKKFKNFKEENFVRVVETLGMDDSEEAISAFNREVRAFWVSLFYFKASYYINSVICNEIAKEKVDASQSESIARTLVRDNSLEDTLTIFSCLTHYDVLSEFYFAQHLDTLGQSGFDLLQAHLEESGIDEITTQVLKIYLGTEVTVSLQTQIGLHYSKLIEQAWEYAKKTSPGPFRDEDLLKYKLVISQIFAKKSIETSEKPSQEIRDIITASFNPFTE